RTPMPAPADSLVSKLIEHFRDVPGITDANERDFPSAETVFCFCDGTSVRAWTNLVRVKHVFVANADGKCEYAGFVGWVHSAGLEEAIDRAPQIAF
ncbi:MAG TPA: hypothetical protein V6D18_09240, partial [Thermosynechococcaceae cyanobacterium]